jgi:hypothetical protein
LICYSKRFFAELDSRLFKDEDVLQDNEFRVLRELEPVLAVSTLQPFRRSNV